MILQPVSVLEYQCPHSVQLRVTAPIIYKAFQIMPKVRHLEEEYIEVQRNEGACPVPQN